MNDKEIRDKILSGLKEAYDKDPHGIVMREKLLLNLRVPTNKTNKIDRNIKYLEQKGLIDVQWFLGGGFYAKINSYGIDTLEDRGKPSKKLEDKYVLHHIFDEIKEFIDKELEEICPEDLERLNLCYKDVLSEHTPHKNVGIALDCREILRDFTDKIFKEEYLQNNEAPPTRNQTKNKLRYILRAKVRSETVKKLVENMEQYFSSLSDYVESRAHASSATNEDAKMCLIYTYLIMGDVLRLLKQNERREG